MAPRVDHLFLTLVGISVLLSLVIVTCVITFAVRYRRRRPGQNGRPTGSVILEAAMLLFPVPLVLGLFLWGAALFARMADPPADALEVYVVAKQWMFKLQHASGQKEIDTLHVPVGRDIRLTMTSQDVVHDFFVPAFRLKADIVPGRYTTLWFNATRAGTYHLFCAEYCGTNHSRMGGTIVAMPPVEFEAWMARGAGDGSLASAGRRLFHDIGCDSCHRFDAQGRGPMLTGLFGATVLLTDGTHVVADQDYLRRSILNPAADVVAGFVPLMPPFQGVLDEEQVLLLVEYIKSIRAGSTVQQPPIPSDRQGMDLEPDTPRPPAGLIEPPR